MTVTKDVMKLLEDRREISKVEATLRVSKEWGFDMRKTVNFLCLWKQPFSQEFKRYLRRNVKNSRDLNHLHSLLVRHLRR